jgi:sulfur relay (sulfurtransferase) DsrF/TusC family protein
MKVLNIVETAYRATLEEQDDTIIWINHAMKGAGADLAVLLQHNAVYYAVKGQDASGLQFGARAQSQPPRLAEDVVKLIGKGVTVYIVEDDVAERGLEQDELIDGVSAVSRAALPRLLSDYDQIWHW